VGAVSQPTPPHDDDFSAMLKRVRAASADAPQQPPPSRRPGTTAAPKRSIAIFLAPAIIIVFVLLVLYGFSSIAVWSASRFVTQAASVNRNSNVHRRLLQLRRVERLRVPVDTSITPLEAGSLLHAISRAGDDSPLLKWERPVDQKLDALDWRKLSSGNPSRLFDPRTDWSVAAFGLAHHGFNAEQRAFLAASAKSPSLAAFRRVARAPSADIGAGSWMVPPDSVAGWPELPVLRTTQLRYAAMANVASAALDLESGRPALAEQRLREVISVGVVLRESARSMFDEAVSGLLLYLGRASLEAFYRAVGRNQEADAISAKSDPQIPAAVYNNDRLPVSQLDSNLRRRILDTTELTSTRWELALGPFAHLPCTSRIGWFFGPSAAQRAELTEFHDALVRFPSDERRFGMPVRTAMQLLDPPSGSRTGPQRARSDVARAISRLMKNDRFERCATLVYW
jgi:hypothetical protein